MASGVLLPVVFVFDLVAFALAVAAEQRRNTATVNVQGDYKYCQYDSDIATGLGVGALVALMASQILIMVASRCLCCGKAMRPSRSRSWAIVLFITCWVFFLIAEVCLLAGSIRNAYHTKYYLSSDHKLSCRELRKGVFGAGAAFVILTGIVSEVYYVSYSRANDGQPSYGRDTGVRMRNI
ncbi:uncharacterized protein LOC110604789 [Manihot esculenta]|uniref:Fiber protein Fb34 n=2 Tax=Manihot esculenta TaxID=3983 RepID=A0A251IUG8_MANES|nr:uncharacterized protein LOC110604789 [Manihot esculenta]XP_021598789.1 uncharacterized protein LOC110604789 [Manihot esculenta]XP_043808665.1 uncharacterized protein LOC110604789 [Manihot esculenta]KAG8634471.1 hypothetical protein MANES_17G042633v8 [Manihot esculenta]OAY24774.1 hypothetical protein MANES_17G042633v8 [Manihot esculenta]OAY24775.1 hypothetical protein MANES_17G042633v8 [Manihot esculenta]